MDNNRCFSGGRELIFNTCFFDETLSVVASLICFIGNPSASSTILVSTTVVNELDEDAVIIDDEVAVAAPRTDNKLLCNAAIEFDELDDEDAMVAEFDDE